MANLAFDLCATIDPRSGIDQLLSPALLARWLESWQESVGLSGPEVSLRSPEFRSLRASLQALFAAAVTHRPLAADAVEAVNRASLAVPQYLRLDASGEPRAGRAVAYPRSNRTEEILAEIARSAIDVLGGPDRERLRACGARGCGRYFLARRPDQRWCSNACGNRERVARHQATRSPRRETARDQAGR